MLEPQIRYRGHNESGTSSRTRSVHQSSEKKPIEVKEPITFLQLFFVLVFTVVAMITVVIIERILPPDIKREDPNVNLDHNFIAYRAMDDLIELTSMGPRVAGSHECEVLAVDWLKEKVEKIVYESNGRHLIRMDVQNVSGSFPLSFLDGLTSVYRDVQNVIVHVRSRVMKEESLLINCHFDSVPDSPGASDDGAGCAVMLEILRVISKSYHSLKYNLIFLFNGAEENLMQGSHGFITQHKWAKGIKAFINIEACGAGGREVLFQAGPFNPWIMEIYAEYVPYPYASSLAQEIFESGLIPGDTDFRIFRDFGNISGFDFAWVTNGYVYHTKFDTVRQIPLGSLQRTGENLLALTTNLVNTKQLEQPSVMEGHPIFFDVLGAFVVRLPVDVAVIVGYGALAMMIANIYLNIASAKKKFGIQPFKCLSELRTTCLVVVISWLITIGSCLGLAVLLTAIARSMSWFSRPLWIYALYVSQTICVPTILILLATRNKRKGVKAGWFISQMYADAILLMWGTLLLFCIVSRIRSGFVAFLWVFFPSLAGLVRNSLGANWTDWRRLFIYMCGVVPPFIQAYYMVIDALYMVIPIMGRTGATSYPELIIAGFVSVLFLLLLGWLIPVILASQTPWKLVNWLLGVILVSVSLVILTPWGFPYSGDINKPTPQRFIIIHTHRLLYSKDNVLVDNNSGFWIVDLDVNSPNSVYGYVPSLRAAVEVGDQDCNMYLYCGVPYPMPAQSLIRHTHWLPGPQPKMPLEASINLTNSEVLNATAVRMHFSLIGPDHIGVMLSPVRGASIKRWSLVEGVKPLTNPPWNHRESYFIYFASGKDPERPYDFHIDISHTFVKVPNYLMDINVVGHYLHGPHKTNSHLTSIVNKFPSWTAVSFWTASLKSYKF